MSEEGWSEVKRKKAGKSNDSSDSESSVPKESKQQTSSFQKQGTYKPKYGEQKSNSQPYVPKSIQNTQKSENSNLSSSGEFFRPNYQKSNSNKGGTSSGENFSKPRGESDRPGIECVESSGFSHTKGPKKPFSKNNQQHYKMIDPSDEKAVEKRKEEIRKRKADKVPEFVSEDEKEKFTSLKKEIPHLKMPQEVRKTQILENIDGLENKLLSEEWISLQAEGWEFLNVVKPDNETPLPEDTKNVKYELYSLENQWGDYALFKLKL